MLDLDGVVWLAGRPIAGAPETVERLRRAGHRVVFLTNNAGPTLADHVGTLRHAGIAATAEELVTSAQAAASLLDPGTRAAMVGGPGITEALAARGIEVVPAADTPAAVVVGRSPVLDYDELATATAAIRGGARFVATNTDATFPTPDGLLPGAGAVIAFLEVSSGRQAEVAGKPHQAVADLVRARFGPVGVMVGDRPDTDGRFAKLAGAPFALVLSGVTGAADLPVTPAPAYVGPDLATVAETILAMPRHRR